MARIIALCLGFLLPATSFAAPPVPLSQFDLGEPPKPVVRLFWLDGDTASVRWADVVRGDEWSLAPADIEGFPVLDAKRQTLTASRVLEGTLLVGVKGEGNGQPAGGWVALSSGVDGHSHGNHIDWHYDNPPEVLMTRLDHGVGRPGELTTSDEAFYLSDAQQGGFLQISVKDLKSRSRNPARSFPGGGRGGRGGTLAVADNRVAYTAWNAADGPEAGRVDVVSLQRRGTPRVEYSFHLPAGSIQAALAHEGRVFFAPEKGLCWIDADLRAQQDAEDVHVNVVDLGTDSNTGTPLRTEALINYRNYVLCCTGTGTSSALCLLDPTAQPVELTKVPITVDDGLILGRPHPKYTAEGKRLALLIQKSRGEKQREQLTIIDLDPNLDQNLGDATVIKSIELDATNGDRGPHSIAFDDDGEYACIANPGTGKIWLLSLTTLEVLEKFDVGGTPRNLVSYGAENPH